MSRSDSQVLARPEFTDAQLAWVFNVGLEKSPDSKCLLIKAFLMRDKFYDLALQMIDQCLKNASSSSRWLLVSLLRVSDCANNRRRCWAKRAGYDLKIGQVSLLLQSSVEAVLAADAL